jgi:hypothetical protein
MSAIAMAAVGFPLQRKATKNNSKHTGPNLSFVAAVKTAPPTYNPWQIGRRIASGDHRHRRIYEIEAGILDRSAHRGSLFTLITSLWRRSLKNVKHIVTLALAICRPLLNPRLCATQSFCRLTICFYLRRQLLQMAGLQIRPS